MLLQNENHAEQVSVGDEPSACTSSSLAHSLALTHTLSSFTPTHTHTHTCTHMHAHAHAHTLSRSKAEKTVTAKKRRHLVSATSAALASTWRNSGPMISSDLNPFFLLLLHSPPPPTTADFFHQNFFWSFYFLCLERKITSVRNAKKWCLLYQWGWRSSWVTLGTALEMM